MVRQRGRHSSVIRWLRIQITPSCKQAGFVRAALSRDGLASLRHPSDCVQNLKRRINIETETGRMVSRPAPLRQQPSSSHQPESRARTRTSTICEFISQRSDDDDDGDGEEGIATRNKRRTRKTPPFSAKDLPS